MGKHQSIAEVYTAYNANYSLSVNIFYTGSQCKLVLSCQEIVLSFYHSDGKETKNDIGPRPLRNIAMLRECCANKMKLYCLNIDLRFWEKGVALPLNKLEAWNLQLNLSRMLFA